MYLTFYLEGCFFFFLSGCFPDLSDSFLVDQISLKQVLMVSVQLYHSSQYLDSKQKREAFVLQLLKLSIECNIVLKVYVLGPVATLNILLATPIFYHSVKEKYLVKMNKNTTNFLPGCKGNVAVSAVILPCRCHQFFLCRCSVEHVRVPNHSHSAMSEKVTVF